MAADVKRSWTGAEAAPDTRRTVQGRRGLLRGRLAGHAFRSIVVRVDPCSGFTALWSGAPARDSPSPVPPYTGADFCNGAVSVARIYPNPLSQSRVRPSGLPIRTMFGAFWRAIRQRSGAGKLEHFRVRRTHILN